MRALGIAFLATGLASATAAAGVYPGPYLALRGSLAFADDIDSEVGGLPLRASLDTGYGGSVAVGHGSPWNLRFELEGLYRYADVGDVQTGAPLVTTATGGNVQAAAAMVNMFYDIPSIVWGITPFVGGGVGGVYAQADFATDPLTEVSGSDWSFGWQLMGGLKVPLGQDVDLTAMYRYFSATDANFRDSAGGSVKSDLTSQSIDVGLDIKF